MWKYIITYCIMTWAQIPCPEGRLGCLVLHEKMVSRDCNNIEIFLNRDSAFIFYNELNMQGRYLYDSIHIDSVKTLRIRLDKK